VIVVIVALAAVAGILVSQKSNKSTAATLKSAPGNEVILAPANSTGKHPFTPSVANSFTVGSATTTTVNASPTTQAGAPPPLVPGGLVGLYGGTMNLSSCDTQQMITYLQQNPSLGQAWAAVEGIPYSSLASYIGSLTPVILRADTQVTNHGYANGVAIPEQSVLQAGTAVLVDPYGVPRARCYCGNPLTPPQLSSTPATYSGQQWSTFSAPAVVDVVPAPAPLTNLTLVNVNNGQLFNRPVATGGTKDVPYVAPAPSATTTTTAPLNQIPIGLTAGSSVPGVVYYKVTFQAPATFSGTAGAIQASDCASLYTSTNSKGALAVVIQGTNVSVFSSSVVLSGTYTPSSKSFTATNANLSTIKGVTQTATMQATSVRRPQRHLRSRGHPPAAACTVSFTGTKTAHRPPRRRPPSSPAQLSTGRCPLLRPR
jgi:hypothetical protein